MPTVALPLGGLSSASPRTDKYCMAVFMGTDNIPPHIHPETTLTKNGLNNAREQAAYDKDRFPEFAESLLIYDPVTALKKTNVRPQLCKFCKLCVVVQLFSLTMAACCNISNETQQERSSDDPKSHVSGRKVDSLFTAVDFGLQPVLWKSWFRPYKTSQLGTL